MKGTVGNCIYLPRDSANLGAKTNLISTAYMPVSGSNSKRTLMESDEDVYHVGSWCHIFLTVNTRGKRCDRGHNQCASQ